MLSDFTLAPCFKISFDLYLTHFDNYQYHSILQFIGDFTNDIHNGQPGTTCSGRFPALGAEMVANGANLRFDFCINEGLISSSDPQIGKIFIDFDRTYHIEIGQKYDSNGRDELILSFIKHCHTGDNDNKVGCVFPMVVVYIQPHWEIGPNEHREEDNH